MSEIKAGDLVMVVHSCCGMHLGYTYVVGSLLTTDFWCAGHGGGCGSTLLRVPCARATGIGTPIAWLKKIDPLAEDVEQERHRELVEHE